MALYDPMGGLMRKQSTRFRFGQRVRELRIKQGWSQKKLAHRANISERYLQRIESQQPPDATIDTIGKLAKAFGLSANKLL